MKKILSIFGTRPEAIKMAPIISALNQKSDLFKNLVCVTAQHREMLDQVLNLFDIVPDYDLDIMKPGQDLFDVTTNVIQGLKNVLNSARPDLVLVHGDTTTTMAAALASYYCKIPVGHVEAGLRTHNKHSPFPEEVNRQVCSILADIHFAPTHVARSNLLTCGVADKDIFVTGNTVIDALFYAIDLIKNTEKESHFNDQFSFLDADKKLILITGHRRENFGTGFESICYALSETASKHPNCEFLYPVHLNPNVREPVNRILGGGKFSNIHIIEPVDYLPFVYLMNRSHFILTDSGGVQEEAPSLGKPVLVMRDTTERPEAIDAGTVKLVGTDHRLIVDSINQLLNNPSFYSEMSLAHNPYGDGRSAHHILDVVSSFFTGSHAKA